MQVLNDARIAKVFLFSILIITAISIVAFIKLITGSYLLGFFTYICIIYVILRYVGRFALYPGSTKYVTEELQQKMSTEILRSTGHIFGHLEHVIQKIHKKQQFYADNRMGTVFDRNTKGMSQILQMFQGTLSKTKQELLSYYRRMRYQIHLQFQQNSLQKGELQRVNFVCIANNPRHLKKLSQVQHTFLMARCQKIRAIATDILILLKEFKKEDQSILTLKGIKHMCIKQKLYEIRFGYYNWKPLYSYDLNKVQMKDGSLIETVVIHHEKSYEQQLDSCQQNSNRKIQTNGLQTKDKPAILFCNPNGVFIQFFALDNAYIRNYLKMGFRVILWNYRGYGQSQSTPSLSQSQKDAIQIYEHYAFHRNYSIPVVHGYSIGGISAVAVGFKYPDHVKVLIADRTFSSIQNVNLQLFQMARSFGDIITALTKIVFYKDNFSLAQQFKKCQNKIKLLICDQNDEVIQQQNSLKRAVLQNIQKSDIKKESKQVLNRLANKKSPQHFSTYQNNYKDQEIGLRNAEDVQKIKKYQDQLVEMQSSTQSSSSKLQSLAFQNELIFDNGFTEVFLSILQQLFNEVYGKQEDKGMDIIVDSLGQQGENSINKKLNQNKALELGYVRMRQRLAQDIIQILSKIDGGGITLFQKNKLHQMLGHGKRSKAKQLCKSYLLGLAYYGSFKPVHNHRRSYSTENIRKQTIEKIRNAIKRLNQILNSEQRRSEQVFGTIPHRQAQAIKSLIKIFNVVMKVLQRIDKNDQILAKLGTLIPTANGHNCDLNNFQFDILHGFLQQFTDQKLSCKQKIQNQNEFPESVYQREQLDF